MFFLIWPPLLRDQVFYYNNLNYVNGVFTWCISDLFVFVSDNQQLILASVVHHLDHKNISHDPELKSYISVIYVDI